jgi:hypothetical protein
VPDGISCDGSRDGIICEVAAGEQGIVFDVTARALKISQRNTDSAVDPLPTLQA